jgi:hypothetical protein
MCFGKKLFTAEITLLAVIASEDKIRREKIMMGGAVVPVAPL